MTLQFEKYSYLFTFLMRQHSSSYCQILSEDEEGQTLNQLKERFTRHVYQSDKLLQQKFDIIVNIVKESMDGTSQQKDQIINKRIKAMYERHLENSSQNFCKKRQPNYQNHETYPIFNQLLIYGTDFWSTKKISQTLKNFSNTAIYKIDASHSKIIFSSDQDAKQYLRRMSLYTEQLSQKIEEQNMENQQLPAQAWLGWIKLTPYQFMKGISRSRQARFATNHELNLQLNVHRDQASFSAPELQLIKENIAKTLMTQFQVAEQCNELFEKKKLIGRELYRNKNKYHKVKHNNSRAQDYSRNYNHQNNNRNYMDRNTNNYYGQNFQTFKKRPEANKDYMSASFSNLNKSRQRSRQKNSNRKKTPEEHNMTLTNNNPLNLQKSDSEVSFSFLLEAPQKPTPQNSQLSFLQDFNNKLNIKDNSQINNMTIIYNNEQAKKNNKIEDEDDKIQGMSYLEYFNHNPKKSQINKITPNSSILPEPSHKKLNKSFSYVEYLNKTDKSEINEI